MTLFECEVFAASEFRATWGINEGQTLGALADLCQGDIYQLARTASPYPLVLRLGTAAQVIEDKSDTAALAGAMAQAAGLLTLMASDGEKTQLFLLLIDGAQFALPLSPLRHGTNYTLIAAEQADDMIPLSEAVQGCFAAGTRITMGDGRLAMIDGLQSGDIILTRDNGAQPLRWIGKLTTRAHGIYAPVTFAPGVLGNLGALSLGPLQRVFLYQRGPDRLGPRAEVMIQSQYLVNDSSIRRRESGFVTYYCLAFDTHQIIYAEGVPVDSMLVSTATRTRLPALLAQDLAERFPHLDQDAHFAHELSDTQSAAVLRQSLHARKSNDP